ncbi:hypothetical protein Tco_0265723 [Tanacetum coccineum]
MVERDDEIKVLGEIKIELQSGTHKVIEKLSQEKVSQQEALEKFKWTVVRDHEIKDVKVEDVSLTCDTPLEVFNNKVSRLCRMDDDSEHEVDDDMGYDPFDIRGDDEVELTDEESSNNEDEVAEVFWIDTNLFDFKTPIPMKTTRMIGSVNGTRTYHSWMDDGYCNGGNLPETYIIGNLLHYQDYEWYEALEESELKDDALRNKVIMEGFIKDDDDESQDIKRGPYSKKSPICRIQICRIQSLDTPRQNINLKLESIKYTPHNDTIKKLRQEEDTEEEAFEEFSSTLDNVLEKLSQENESPYNFYGLMYDTDDDSSISGNSCEHFGWDWDSPGIAEEVIEMANDQAEALSFDKEVTDECLDDKHVGESRPSKRIRVTKESGQGS